jgi:hypothetical protein
MHYQAISRTNNLLKYSWIVSLITTITKEQVNIFQGMIHTSDSCLIFRPSPSYGSFFIEWNLPPSPLTLFMACICLDSCRYFWSKNYKFYLKFWQYLIFNFMFPFLLYTSHISDQSISHLGWFRSEIMLTN